MTTSRLTVAAGVLCFALQLPGCDSAGQPNRDDVAADDDDDDGSDDDGGDADDDDDQQPEPVIGPALSAVPPQAHDDDHGPGTPSGLHPCGNATLDEGEACDDGLANGNDRECTLSCTLNDCDLDENGFCDDDNWPVADVPLYPCTDTRGSPRLCTNGVTAP